MNPHLYMMLSPFTPLITEPITEEDIAACDTGLAVYVISRNSGEGGDRRAIGGDYYLSDMELSNLKMIASRFEKVIVLLNIGGVIDMSAMKKIEGINSVVLLNQLGSNTGVIAADLLLGKAIPSGKLSDTWACDYADYSSSEGFGMNDNDVQDEYYSEGIYTGYRYFDAFDKNAVYEFGYGKTYTEFKISDETVSVNGEEITVSAVVTNVGTVYPGKEVVQVYVSAPTGKLDKPYKELRAFKKTKELAPGEAETVTMTFKASSMASYCTECASMILESGDYIVHVGNSSWNLVPAGVITLDETKVVRKLKNLMTYSDEKVVDLTPPEKYTQIIDGILRKLALSVDVRLTLKAADIPSDTVTYTGEYTELTDVFPGETLKIDDVLSGKADIAALTAQLSDEDMAYLSVGNSVKKRGFESVVGQASDALPGAAGETTDRMKDSRNIKMMELCDGPAGVRVSPEFIELENGTAVPAGGVGAVVSDLPDGVRHYQYATAIPIAFALASSWNMELLEACGDIVGGEMSEFGVTLWLAPGMNIHRNPLCGRNFEYYSEGSASCR